LLGEISLSSKYFSLVYQRKTIWENILSKFIWLGGGFLFLLMLTAPFQYYAFKICILVILILLSIQKILKTGQIKISSQIAIWFVIFIAFGVFFSIVGFTIAENNPSYIIKSSTVNIVWPLCYFFLIPYLSRQNNIIFLQKIMIVAIVWISLYLIFAAFSYLGLIPIPPSFFSSAIPVIGKYDATVQLFLPSTTSLLFLIPFLITYLLLQIFKQHNVHVIWIIATLLLSIIAVVITGRRALILNLLVSPFLIYIFLKLANVKLAKPIKSGILKLFVIFLGVSAIGIFFAVKYEILNLSPLVELFQKGFDMGSTSEDEGSAIRGSQSAALIQSWKDYPILGSGFGSASQYVIRSEDTPWVYELSYLTLLFQTGLCGFIIYLSLLFWIFYKGVALIRKSAEYIFLLPLLVGCLCFLLGNASNPYLVAFDHMWAIFLPIGLINYCIFADRNLI